MEHTNWLLLDTETTGLAAPIFVVELAAQRMRGWSLEGEPFRKLLNQNQEIPADVSERLKAASSERFKSGHFEVERLIAEAGSDEEQLRDESTQNEPATVNHHVMAARVVLPADRAGVATASGDGFQICPAT